MIKVNFDKRITQKDVDELSRKYPNKNIIIVLKNTKLQKASDIDFFGKRYPNIIYSITGGLDPEKEKFNSEHYQRRTYYTGLELSKIIEIFSKIERQIVLSWTETQKVMFVYKELCNYMEYDEIEVNNRDYSRGIGGLLYHKAVCSGFAMILKEALDRLGIENYYQNREGHHSWNIAKVDGAYRAFELTWDTSNKSEKGCAFLYFNQDRNFYNSKHHNIKYESEEKEFPIVPYTVEELKRNYDVISKARIIKIPFIKNNYRKTTSEIKINNASVILYLNNGIINLNGNIKYKQFIRKDNTSFIIVPVENLSNNGLYKFVIFEPREKGIVCSTIYSELQLDLILPQYESTIANGLLSKERLSCKIKDFNGYVGYIGNNHSIYYDKNFEEEKLNIIR